MAKVRITETGYGTLVILSRYMAEFIGADKALELAEKLLSTAESHLSKFPKKCPICHELDLIGVTDYRQLTIDKYKILYRYDDDSDLVYITAFLRQKQSAQELLISYTLLRLD